MAILPSFNRILLVTDFSSSSETAVPFARLLAEHYGATVFVAHVIPESAPKTVVPSPAAPGEGDEARGAAEAQMRKFLTENPLGEVPVETIIGQGPVADVLATVIQEKKNDLVVIGTHGRSGVGKLVLGSVAQRIFNIASCPVLSVSARARKSWRAAEKFARILYATDFSADSLQALPYALSLAKVGNAELLVLHASAEPLMPEMLREYDKRLNALVPPEAKMWCKSDTIVLVGNPVHSILKAAAEHNADFIVIGAHPAAGMLHVPLTTPYQIVAHAHCPVLRVRATDAEM
jgi:nucleotide-binding universal stress UspA family protein